MSDLLPPNATPQERALSDAVARIGNVPTPTRQLWNPQTCPAALLPWLAWAFSVDDWNTEWSEQQKRDVIAASFTVHRSKGTIGAVKASLAALGYNLTLTEWFQDADNLDPYTFIIDVDTQGNPLRPTVFTDVVALTERSKNTRSHLARLRVTTNNTANPYAGGATIFGTITEVFDEQLAKITYASNLWDYTMNTIVPENMEL
jgi:phage tail P2-like protein